MTPRCWKLAEDLTLSDLQAYPVWEFVSDENEAPDTAVRAVVQLPVTDLAQRLVGVKIILSNGTERWAILGNVSLRNRRATEHFLCVSVEKHGHWFHLARYHDVDFAERGPAALAQFLGLPVGEIFPLSYDIGHVAVGDPAVLRANVTEIPPVQLTDDEIIQLSLEA